MCFISLIEASLLSEDIGSIIASLPVLSWSRADTEERLRQLDNSEGSPEAVLLELLVKCRCGRVMTRGAVRVHVCAPPPERIIIDLTSEEDD